MNDWCQPEIDQSSARSGRMVIPGQSELRYGVSFKALLACCLLRVLKQEDGYHTHHHHLNPLSLKIIKHPPPTQSQLPGNLRLFAPSWHWAPAPAPALGKAAQQHWLHTLQPSSLPCFRVVIITGVIDECRGQAPRQCEWPVIGELKVVFNTQAG